MCDAGRAHYVFKPGRLPVESTSPASSVTATPCLELVLSRWSSARRRDHKRMPPCACAGTAACWWASSTWWGPALPAGLTLLCTPGPGRRSPWPPQNLAQLAACHLLATRFAAVRATGRQPSTEPIGSRLQAPCEEKVEKTGRQGAHRWFASKYANAKRRLLHFGRQAGLRRSAGRQSEIQGDRLHPPGPSPRAR